MGRGAGAKVYGPCIRLNGTDRHALSLEALTGGGMTMSNDITCCTNDAAYVELYRWAHTTNNSTVLREKASTLRKAGRKQPTDSQERAILLRGAGLLKRQAQQIERKAREEAA